MSAPPLKKPVITCLNKQRHPDEFVARAVAMRALNHPKCSTDTLFVYRCKQCRGWHLTKSDNGISQKITADNPIHERNTNGYRLAGY